MESFNAINDFSSIKSNNMNIPFLENNNESEQQNAFIPESTYYNVKLDDLKFQIYKKVLSNGFTTIAIIGSDGEECAQIRYPQAIEDKEMLLAGVSYKGVCSIGKEMLPGKETIQMIKALLIFSIKQFPHEKHIGFMDDSHKACMTNTVKTLLELPDTSYYLTGQTWYQKHFGAVPDSLNPHLPELLKDIDAALNSSLHGDIKNMFARFGRNHPIGVIQDIIISEFMKGKQNKITWREFLQNIFERKSKLSQKYGEDALCVVLDGILPKIRELLNLHTLQGTLWNVPAAVIMSYPEYSKIIIEETTQPRHARVYRGGKSRRKRNVTKTKILSFGKKPLNYWGKGGSWTRRNPK